MSWAESKWLSDKIAHGVPVIRHIQRGIVAISDSDSQSVTLSGFTDVKKMSVKLFGSTCYIGGSSASGADSVTAYVDSLTSTKLVVKVPRNSSGSISYEVIEYY